jgi:phosphoribosylformylglycinamidine synthase II
MVQARPGAVKRDGRPAGARGRKRLTAPHAAGRLRAVPVYRLEIEPRPGSADALAAEAAERLHQWLGLLPTRVRTRKVLLLDLEIDDREAMSVLGALVDPVAEVGALGLLPDGAEHDDAPILCTVGLRPGVTDSVGTSVKRAVEDRLGRALDGRVYTATQYLLWGLDESAVWRAADGVLHNPLIESVRIERPPRALDLAIPRAGGRAEPHVGTVPLTAADDAELLRISTAGMLALSLVEMRAIRAHFVERGRDPTDAELECLAQTWSEHCKHKIFAAPIDVTDEGGGTERIEEGLFRRYIRGATEAVEKARARAAVDPEDAAFLVSVFHDNAGVVRFTEADHLVYKVETHNSPSALDPYGGAMTGIVGVNRDSFGTGIGADLLANVWGYCFADPRWDDHVPRGLMHPRRLRDGVHRGVVDGGNQSGIPYLRGWELFDARYLGKPLVFCGTVAVMPVDAAGRPTHEKRQRPGDAIVMVGGRIGKDGIHGATFSSVELDESSPVQAVQIGDPITQKMMFDMLAEARDRGLVASMTDNGAGGLSSSVGEMAEATGGATMDLSKAPLKYPGLMPWEVLISEAQERMTLAIAPEHLAAFLELAREREVEATVLGEFTRSGRLVCTWGDTPVVDLPLSFLHDGCPRVVLTAKKSDAPLPVAAPSTVAEVLGDRSLAAGLRALLSMPELASPEERARSYDHEVKGLSVVKPLVGAHGDVPATATVMRARHGRPEGVVLAEGVHPFYADLDARQMALACVDEAVRRILCAGARWDRMAALDNFCWPDPVKSDKTPDGEHKLWQLVQTCRGLREACEGFGLPLVSGKDSMKNDANLEGKKISIPPTLLVSAIGQMPDVRRALTLEPRTEGDDVWIVGPTRSELGGSAVLRARGLLFGDVPRTDIVANAARYQAFVALRDAGRVRSAHVTGRGGLAIALAHMVMASLRTVEVDLGAIGEMSGAAALFSESTGRIVFTASAADRASVTAALSAHGLERLGSVGGHEDPHLRIRRGGEALVDLAVGALRQAFRSGLAGL